MHKNEYRFITILFILNFLSNYVDKHIRQVYNIIASQKRKEKRHGKYKKVAGGRV